MDCACDYGNEEEVGEAIKEAIEAEVVTRKVGKGREGGRKR